MATGNEKYVDYLNLSPRTWKRPEIGPRVWGIFDGRRKMPSGDIPRFTIREITEDLVEEVIDFLVEYFLPDEPISADADLSNDPVGIREFRTMWKHALDQGISLVALTVNSDPTVKPLIAGVNVLIVTSVNDESDPECVKRFRSKGMRGLMDIFTVAHEKADVFKRYGVDKCLGSFGLSVHPSFRGQGLGEELIRMRDDIGIAYQIPVSQTAFSATASQLLATRNGFEVLSERKYSEILDAEGNPAFPGITVPAIKSMGKRLY